MENNQCISCEKCDTCQSDIAPHITKTMLEAARAKNNGQIPREFLREKSGSGCENCFSCEKCVSYQGGGGDEQQQKLKAPGDNIGFVTYFVHLTQDCNLRCDYCYATKTPPSMNEEILNDTINFIFYEERKRIPSANISIQFFGGEPTMMWPELVNFVDRSNRIALDNQINVRWGMTTNVTLLNESRLRWLKHKEFGLLLSIDGRAETHNKHRRTVADKGSFSMIPLNLIMKYYPNCEIRPTVMPDTVEDFVENIKWFHSKQFFTVATEVAYEADWTDEAMEKARVAYEALGDMYIKRRQANLPMWMKFIEDGRGSLPGGAVPTGPVCGTARNTMAVDATGRLFACQRYASFSEPALSIGNVKTGFDKVKLEAAQTLKREHMIPDPEGDFFCKECPARSRCRGGCNASNYQANGDRRYILQNYCKFQRLWAEITLRVLAATGELNQQRGSQQSCNRR